MSGNLLQVVVRNKFVRISNTRSYFRRSPDFQIFSFVDDTKYTGTGRIVVKSTNPGEFPYNVSCPRQSQYTKFLPITVTPRVPLLLIDFIYTSKCEVVVCTIPLFKNGRALCTGYGRSHLCTCGAKIL